jgi:hypothetical protein
MTAVDLIANLRALGPQELPVILHFLADHALEGRLTEGQRLCDVTDFKAWLRELAEAFRNSEPVPEALAHSAFVTGAAPFLGGKVLSTKYICPDCHHEHEGRNECSKYLGEEKFCHCESKVTA